MNSNRTKYASTPTYGMQKRNFSKKQTPAQATPTPDFTQQPALDPNTLNASFPAQSPFAMPQNVFPGSSVLPTSPMFLNNSNNSNPNVPFPAGSGQPNYGNAPGLNGYTFMPGTSQPGAFPYSQPSQGINPAPGNNSAMFAPRAQGFVPQGYAQAGSPLPPNVMRSEPVGGLGSMSSPGMTMNGMPPVNTLPPMGASVSQSGMYTGAGFPGGNMGGGSTPSYGNAGFPQGMMNNSPNMNGFQRPPYMGMDGGMPASPTPRQPFDMDHLMKILLYGVLPALFIPCAFVSHIYDFIRYLFIVLSVISLSIIWYRQSFTSGIRTVISILFLALSIIVIALLISGNQDVTQNGVLGSNLAAAQVTAEPTVSPESAANVEVTASPMEDPGESEAEQRLSTFMDYWANNNVEEMTNLVQPSWASQQDDPASALFTVISNRTPKEYVIESISGTGTDSSRTVTMSAYIDKNNGKDPVRYRFMILMVKESGEWYVDPNSLATNDTVDETTAAVAGQTTISQSLAPRMTVTPIPDPSTKLYYNATGGKYYHIDPNCSAVNPKYLPMASFLYSELDDPPYDSLEPCLKCGAPTQSLGSIATDTTSTATPAP